MKLFLCLREKGILKDLIKHILKYVLKANKKIALSCKKKDTGDIFVNRYSQMGMIGSILPGEDLVYTEN